MTAASPQLAQDRAQFVGRMPDRRTDLEDVRGHESRRSGGGAEVDADRCGPGRGVSGQRIRGDGAGVDDDVIQRGRGEPVGGQRLEVRSDPVAVGLSGLRHEIAHQDARPPCLRHGLAQAGDDKGGENARVEASRAQDHYVGGVQRLEHPGRRRRVRGLESDPDDRRAASRAA